jgi:membrane-associated phospholipid phosphatase
MNYPRRKNMIERTALSVGVAILFIGGYFGVGYSRDAATAHCLFRAVDHQIPFVAASVWVYLMLFPIALSPVVLAQCPRLFRRTALAYACTIIASLICFTVYPVTSVDLRADAATLATSGLAGRVLSVLYILDPPYNLLPSLHVSIAMLAALSAWKVAKRYGVLLAVAAFSIAASACLVKQHFALDVLAAAALAAVAGGVTIGTYDDAVVVKSMPPTRTG